MRTAAPVDRSHAGPHRRSSPSNRALGDASRLRVMHLVYRLQEGGMEGGVLKIVNGLRGSGIDSSVCSTVPASSLRNRLESDVPLFECRRRPGNDPFFVWQLYRLLKRERPHILHTHAWGTLCEGLIAGRLAGVPVIVHGEHGSLQTRKRQIWVQRWAWQRTDRLLAVSSNLADRMAQVVGVPRDRIQTIRNGVDAQRFQLPSRREARFRLGLPVRAFVVGTVGRLVEVKDHFTFLEALRLLTMRGVPVEGVIAGDGPLRPAVESRIATFGLWDHVRLLGHRSDTETVLAALECFVLSSRSEGLPNTILEAMASGLPVVATRVGGADELVEDGRTGLLVAPQSPEQLARAIGLLANDQEGRQRMGAAGRARVEREFSLEAMVAAYEKLYLDVARERRVTPGPCGPMRALTRA